MGMYTEFIFNSRLKDINKNTINILEHMTGIEKEGLNLPSHPLFKSSRWTFMLRSDSYYFDSVTNSKLNFDELTNKYTLNITCNFKNYDGEISKFIDWISPYIDKIEGELVGYSRYEEFQEPDLIYYSGGSLEYT